MIFLAILILLAILFPALLRGFFAGIGLIVLILIGVAVFG